MSTQSGTYLCSGSSDRPPVERRRAGKVSGTHHAQPRGSFTGSYSWPMALDTTYAAGLADYGGLREAQRPGWRELS